MIKFGTQCGELSYKVLPSLLSAVAAASCPQSTWRIPTFRKHTNRSMENSDLSRLNLEKTPSQCETDSHAYSGMDPNSLRNNVISQHWAPSSTNQEHETRSGSLPSVVLLLCLANSESSSWCFQFCFKFMCYIMYVCSTWLIFYFKRQNFCLEAKIDSFQLILFYF